MRYFTTSLAVFAAMACLTGGALAKAPDSTQGATIVPVESLPPPRDTGAMGDDAGAYELGPFDTVDIAVFQVDMLDRTLQVDSSGYIDFPIIGEVKAAGLTTKELGAEIAAELGKSYLQSPQITVYLKGSASLHYTVEGAVKASGTFPLEGRMTLLRAIASAQGVSDEAKDSDVVIFRTVDDRRLAGMVNLKEVRQGAATDPQIYAGDVIVVPVSGGRRAFKDLISAMPLLFWMH